MICQNCGTNNPDGMGSCSRCGAPLNPGFNYGNYNSTMTQGSRFQPIPIAHRNILVCILLTFVTCGIYGIYWFVCITNDTNRLTPAPDTSGGLAFLFSFLTCGIYGFYWSYRKGEIICEYRRRQGIPASSDGVMYLILSLCGLSIITLCLIQHDLNKIASKGF